MFDIADRQFVVKRPNDALHASDNIVERSVQKIAFARQIDNQSDIIAFLFR